MLLTPSLSPCWTTKWQPQDQKASVTLHGNASAKHETSATLHGNAFRLRKVQLRPPKESAAYWKIKLQSAKTEKQNLPTLHGNAIAGKHIGKQSTGAPNAPGITRQHLPTLHGNAISSKKRTPRCTGALTPRSRIRGAKEARDPSPQTPRQLNENPSPAGLSGKILAL